MRPSLKTLPSVSRWQEIVSETRGQLRAVVNRCGAVIAFVRAFVVATKTCDPSMWQWLLKQHNGKVRATQQATFFRVWVTNVRFAKWRCVALTSMFWRVQVTVLNMWDALLCPEDTFEFALYLLFHANHTGTKTVASDLYGFAEYFICRVLDLKVSTEPVEGESPPERNMRVQAARVCSIVQCAVPVSSTELVERKHNCDNAGKIQGVQSVFHA